MKTILAGMALLLLMAQDQDDQSIPKGVDLSTWTKLGLENRWVTFRHSVTAKNGLIQNWVRFLDSRDDFELLELIAIHGGNQAIFQKGNPGEVLHRRDAPQWMRVAVWNLRQRDSHSVDAAATVLEQQAGRFMGWAKKYPGVKRLNGAELMAKFDGVAVVDPGDQLPPLDPQAVILPFLDAPPNLATLAPNGAFDRRQRYRFQVLRAIGAISVAGRFEEPFLGKLLRLTRHADQGVRRAAMLEFSEFPADEVPFAELVAMADNPDLEGEDRKSALLAASYSNHPEVFLALHGVLMDPEHPGFDAVVQRMSALGNGYTLQVLGELPRTGIPQRRRAGIRRLERALGDRARAGGSPAGLLLHRAAWAVFKKDHQREELLDWTRAHMRLRLVEPKFRTSIGSFARSLEGSAIPRSLHDWIRGEARRLLDSK